MTARPTSRPVDRQDQTGIGRRGRPLPVVSRRRHRHGRPDRRRRRRPTWRRARRAQQLSGLRVRARATTIASSSTSAACASSWPAGTADRRAGGRNARRPRWAARMSRSTRPRSKRLGRRPATATRRRPPATATNGEVDDREAELAAHGDIRASAARWRPSPAIRPAIRAGRRSLHPALRARRHRRRQLASTDKGPPPRRPVRPRPGLPVRRARR